MATSSSWLHRPSMASVNETPQLSATSSSSSYGPTTSYLSIDDYLANAGSGSGSMHLDNADSSAWYNIANDEAASSHSASRSPEALSTVTHNHASSSAATSPNTLQPVNTTASNMATSAQPSTSLKAPNPAKKSSRRACDPCRLRRVKCDRAPGQHDCIKCQALQIKCIDSVPRARTSHKGARIAQAKMLYGDTAEGGDTSAWSFPQASSRAFGVGDSREAINVQIEAFSRNAKHANAMRSLYPGGPTTTFPYADVNLAQASESGLLIAQLIRSASRMRLSYFPLLRWINIAAEFDAAGSSLLGMDPTNQALYLGLAAMVARGSGLPALVGDNAPSLADVGMRRELRKDNTLCTYGHKRERLATHLMDAFITKIHESGVFATLTLRTAIVLTLAEMLIQVWRDADAWTKTAAAEARSYSAAAAECVRAVGEAYADGTPRDWGWYSTVWTLVIRDSLIGVTSGRALHFSLAESRMLVNNDMSLILPTPTELCEGWIGAVHEGKSLMNVWGVIVRQGRILADEAAQPLARARARLKLEFFEPVYASLRGIRTLIDDATTASLQISPGAGQPFPDQVGVIRYCSDWLIGQANGLVGKRFEEAELGRARAEDPFTYQEYLHQLQTLRVKAADEAFQAARRVVSSMQGVFSSRGGEAAEFFVPGYFIFEGIPLWADLLLQATTVEEGGRQDYNLETKMADLQIMREALAVVGWSTANVSKHIRTLDASLSDLRTKSMLFRSHVGQQRHEQQQEQHQPPQFQTLDTPSFDALLNYNFCTNGGTPAGPVDSTHFAQLGGMMQSQPSGQAGFASLQTQQNAMPELDLSMQLSPDISTALNSLQPGGTADWIEAFLKQQGGSVQQ